MNTTDTSFNKAQTTNSPSKTQDPAKQARDFGREVKGQATELAKNATDAVKTQAANLTESAKDVAADAGEKLRTTLQEQKAAGADYVGNVANIVRQSAYAFDSDIPQAGHYIRKAAAQLDNVSEAMRNRDMSEIVGNVQQFARRQPTAFFGAAVLLGFAAVRFLKSGTGSSNMPRQVASGDSGRTAGL
jgi:3-deoxy-D-arabino-heptulosonate 7-phosphate (DAHP) synthase